MRRRLRRRHAGPQEPRHHRAGAHRGVLPEPPRRGRRRARHRRRRRHLGAAARQLLPGGRRLRAARRRARTRPGSRSCPSTGPTRPPTPSRRCSPTRASRCSAGARFRSSATAPGASAREQMPVFAQVFVAKNGLAGDELERHVYLARKRIEHETDAYFASLSSRVVVYKGMLTPAQLGEFYPDLRDERFESALGLVHSRFSTNTFPSWPLAHPYRMLAHNGEINTVQGNENWMRAREGVMASELLPGDLERAFPICTPGASDTARFDEALELLNLAGRPLHHAILMMIPEAWENHESMDAPAQGVLPLPLRADGAVGRSRVDRVQRRHRDRRGPRPQRPAPVALLGHRRRPRDHGERGRRARHRPGQDRAQGPLGAGEDLPRRHDPGPHHPRRGDQGRARGAAAVRAVARRRSRAPRRVAAAVPARPAAQLGRAAAAHVRLHRGRPAPDHRPDGAQRGGVARVDGNRHAGRGALRPAAHALRLLQAAVRAGDEPAARRQLRGARHVAQLRRRTRGQPARPDPRLVPPDRVPEPDPHQRGAGEAALHRRRRLRGVRASRRSRCTATTRSPKAATACASRSTTCARR